MTPFTILPNYAVSTLPLSNYFYPSVNIHKTLWPIRQGNRLLPYGTFKNAGSKRETGSIIVEPLLQK